MDFAFLRPDEVLSGGADGVRDWLAEKYGYVERSGRSSVFGDSKMLLALQLAVDRRCIAYGVRCVSVLFVNVCGTNKVYCRSEE